MFDRASQVMTAITAALVILSVVNALLVTWATVLDARLSPVSPPAPAWLSSWRSRAVSSAVLFRRMAPEWASGTLHVSTRN
jgi:hypothetical protein